MTAKHEAIRMIKHTHYDRKLGKFIHTMIPETKEHKEQVSKFKLDKIQTKGGGYYKKGDRAWNE